MYLIIDKVKNRFTISRMPNCSKDEVIIENYDFTNIDLATVSNTHKVNATQDGIEFDTIKQINDAIQAKKDEIELAYYVANYADIDYEVATVTHTFQADKESQDLMTKAIALGSVPTGFYWKDKYNVRVPMTYAELQGLGDALGTRTLQAFTVMADRKDALENVDKVVTNTNTIDLILTNIGAV